MLSNQSIVLIGGSGTLGSAFLKTATDLGAKCAVVGRSAPKAKAPFFRADISSAHELGEAASQARAALGGLDAVVNFAGTHHQPMDLAKDDPVALLAEYRRVIEVNLTGSFVVTAVFAKLMVRARHGHIIHLCSNASRLALYGSYAYNISKHGVEALIKTAAAQLAPFGVRVNGVAPGTVETGLNRSLLRSSSGGYSPRAASILAHTPTKRFATADGVAQTIASMCVPQRHLTGNVVFCDDGYNVEGHSWPEGTTAVYAGGDAVDELYDRIDRDYPRER